MIIALRILLIVVALICFLGGANIMLKGANYFLPKETPPQLVLDNLVRFLSGIYFGFWFLLIWSAYNLNSIHDLIYFFGIIVAFSGLGRLYSRIKVGSAGKYFDYIMLLEILLGITFIILEFFRKN